MKEYSKTIIVEGRSDKTKVEALVNEPLEIICTNGTINSEKLDTLIEEHNLDEKDVFILTDADESGEKLRKQLRKELPNAVHIYIDKTFKEVAASPDHHIATVLLSANIDIHPKYLLK